MHDERHEQPVTQGLRFLEYRVLFESGAGHALIKRIPQRRLGRMSGLDGPSLLLCSDASAFITGAVIAVDGDHLVSTL